MTTPLSLLDWRRRVAEMYTDVRSEADPAAAHERWCATRNELVASHPESPLRPDARATFQGLSVAPYNPRFRFEATIDDNVKPLRIDIQTGTDGIVRFERLGIAHLANVGDLDVWWLVSYGGGVFVPVKDALAGQATYGGGRYVVDTVKGADLGGNARSLVIDFNFAYNPSCAYDPRWECPLAPAGNVVDVPLPVGEQNFPSFPPANDLAPPAGESSS